LVVCAVFKSCTALRPYIAHLDDIYKDFNNYKFRVPVSGAIILDDAYERVIYYFFLPILVHF
jgi:mRNA-decapping enzyme subunit 2